MISFGERLVEARKRKNLSQKKLAELLEVTPTSLNYWEKGKREPTVAMIKRISGILNVSADYLIGIDENRNNLISVSRSKHKEIIEFLELLELLNASQRAEVRGYMMHIISKIQSEK